MSSGLQHAAAASFFPTAKELSSGIQWCRDHPVLAAAAATAVSVLTYLNATERGDEASELSSPPQPPQPQPPLLMDAEDARGEEQAARPALKSAVRSPCGDGSPPLDGRLSAAVSWCDEHGGSLTQVFEELASEDEDEDEDEDALDLDQPLRLLDLRRPPPRVLATDSGAGRMKKSATAARLLDPQGSPSPVDAPADEPETESPQWGWYVPITPPQDLPRAMAAVRPLADPRPLPSLLVDSRRE